MFVNSMLTNIVVCFSFLQNQTGFVLVFVFVLFCFLGGGGVKGKFLSFSVFVQQIRKNIH